MTKNQSTKKFIEGNVKKKEPKKLTLFLSNFVSYGMLYFFYINLDFMIIN